MPYADPIKKKAYELKRLAVLRERRRTDPEFAAKSRASSKRWYDNKFATDPDYKKRKYKHRVVSKYGLTVEQYELMLDKQDRKCLICKAMHQDEKGKQLVIDHNHLTDITDVRGLICNTCNLGLGLFKDNPEFLKAAAAYLEQ